MKKKRFACILILVCAVVSMVTACGGCSDGREAGLPSPASPSGYEFTADNMVAVADAGVDAFFFFPGLSCVLYHSVEIMEAPHSRSPFELSAHLCQNDGEAILIWDMLDAGGHATLEFRDCAFAADAPESMSTFSGHISMTVNRHDAAAEKPLAFLDAQLHATLSGRGGQEAFMPDSQLDLNCQLRLFRSPAVLGFRYGGSEEDPDALLEKRQGHSEVKLGCFDVNLTFPVDGRAGDFALGDSRISPLFGVFLAENNLFSVTSNRREIGADLHFENWVPVGGGGLQFLGFAAQGGCNAFDPVHAAGPSDNPRMSMHASAPGKVRLDLFREGGPDAAPFVTREVPWSTFIRR
jgi:hypothetical protein